MLRNTLLSVSLIVAPLTMQQGDRKNSVQGKKGLCYLCKRGSVQWSVRPKSGVLILWARYLRGIRSFLLNGDEKNRNELLAMIFALSLAWVLPCQARAESKPGADWHYGFQFYGVPTWIQGDAQLHLGGLYGGK